MRLAISPASRALGAVATPTAQLDPQVWNLYAYARNNPVRLVDRDGQEEEDALEEYAPWLNRSVKTLTSAASIIKKRGGITAGAGSPLLGHLWSVGSGGSSAKGPILNEILYTEMGYWGQAAIDNVEGAEEMYEFYEEIYELYQEDPKLKRLLK